MTAFHRFFILGSLFIGFLKTSENKRCQGQNWKFSTKTVHKNWQPSKGKMIDCKMTLLMAAFQIPPNPLVAWSLWHCLKPSTLDRHLESATPLLPAGQSRKIMKDPSFKWKKHCLPKEERERNMIHIFSPVKPNQSRIQTAYGMDSNSFYQVPSWLWAFTLERKTAAKA